VSLGLRQLRYFVAIADAGVFARAAEALNIAQSALSHHVSEVEADLGVKLLERLPRGIALTPAGRRLYQHACAILSAAAKAEVDVKTFTEIATGPVSVGLSHTAEAAASLNIMQAIGQSCPHVRLTIAEGLSPVLVERVLVGALDYAIIFNPPNDARLTRQPLLEEELFLIGQKEVIGKPSSSIAFSDIPQGAVLGLQPVPASRSIIQEQILRNQITPNPRLEIDSLSAMRKALEAGLGCAILARSTVGAELSEGKVHARRIVEPPITRTLSLVGLVDHPQTRAFVEVGQILRRVIINEVKEGRWPAKLVIDQKPPKTGRRRRDGVVQILPSKLEGRI
jgi:LysR family transcriptional regulator, nitrogen assimilation regulatory protein